MIFKPLSIHGTFEILLEPYKDPRGLFARTYCAEEFSAHDLNTSWVQSNMSISKSAGTIRGLHFQRQPHTEIKMVRAQKGRVWDVLLDLREGSASFGQHMSITLDADTRNAVYIPAGIAHGFQTLEDNCELQYVHSSPYVPEAEGGVQALDPELGIKWPLTVKAQSPRDLELPFFKGTSSIC